jgi:hypothetical protein
VLARRVDLLEHGGERVRSGSRGIVDSGSGSPRGCDSSFWSHVGALPTTPIVLVRDMGFNNPRKMLNNCKIIKSHKLKLKLKLTKLRTKFIIQYNKYKKTKKSGVSNNKNKSQEEQGSTTDNRLGAKSARLGTP